MNPDDENVIEMRASETEEGKIRYVRKKLKRPSSGVSGWAIKILGVVFGVAAFLLVIFFFVYVIVPLILILILYSLLRTVFKPQR